MNRYFILLLTNLLTVIVITVLLSIFGVDFSNTLGLAFGCLIYGFVGAFISLQLSKWTAKQIYDIQIIQPNTTNETELSLLKMVKDLTIKADLPMPEVGIYESNEPNAFATGSSKSNSLIAFSSGLITLMNEDEVKAVAGHEVGHIANGDMLTMTLLMGVANAFVLFLARFVARIIDNYVAEKEDSFGLSIWGYWLLVYGLEIVFMLLAYIPISYFSRMREYKADEYSAKLTSPISMANALKRLDDYVDNSTNTKRNSLIFAQISNKHKVGLFATHPPLQDRIDTLLQGVSVLYCTNCGKQYKADSSNSKCADCGASL